MNSRIELLRRQYIIMLLCVGMVCSSFSQQIAFPGAEGYGKYASGGRGGRVIEVTSLLDKDRYGNTLPGTLRAALNTEGDDPITIVFKVSGVIKLSNFELKSSRSNMTIAGQTAPGDGICIKNGSIKLSGSNLIIRYLRFRPGDELKSNVSGLNIENAHNFIVDHCSFSWAIEENATFYDNKYTTIQWCIISESLYNSYHSKGARGYAGQWGGQYASYHHNLIAHNNSRSPRINGSRAHDTVALLDFRNNVIFNWRNSGAIYGGEQEIFAPEARCNTNMINNYYKPGPATSSSLYFAAPSYVSEGNTANGYAKWYFAGNYMEGISGGMNDDNWLGVDASDVGGIENIKAFEEFAVEPVTTYSAYEAFDTVLAGAGAILPIRDAVDLRIIKEVKGDIPVTGDGSVGEDKGIIDSQTAVGGWPEYRMPATENIPVDTDHDGMPDEWEINAGLDPENPDDGKIITTDGYSNLEHYLNSNIKYIEPALSLTDFIEENKITIYPNPASGKVYIQSTEIIKNIRLFTIQGYEIPVEKNNDGRSVEFPRTLREGIYFVEIIFKNGNKKLEKITIK
jgi:pectate lyase